MCGILESDGTVFINPARFIKFLFPTSSKTLLESFNSQLNFLAFCFQLTYARILRIMWTGVVCLDVWSKVDLKELFLDNSYCCQLYEKTGCTKHTDCSECELYLLYSVYWLYKVCSIFADCTGCTACTGATQCTGCTQCRTACTERIGWTQIWTILSGHTIFWDVSAADSNGCAK